MARRFKEVVGEKFVPLVRFVGPGQEFTGTFLGKREHNGRYGRETVADFRDEGGEDKVVVLTWDLHSKVGRLKPGTLVRIVYVKDEDVGERNPIRRFRVEEIEDDGEPEGGEPEATDTPF
jgi:hypothetical protein